MQDAPVQSSPETDPHPPHVAPRALSLPALLASIVVIMLGIGVWLGVIAGLILAAATLFDGMEILYGLIDDFERFDPRRPGSNSGSQRAVFAGGVVIYLAALASLVCTARLFGGRSMASMLGWTGPWPAMTRIGWLLIACAAVYHLIAGSALRYFFPEFALWIIPPRDAISLILSFVMIVILAPLIEELFFRGWLFGSLRARFSAVAAILVTAVAFAIVHMDTTGLYPIAVLAPGLVLSVIRERTGSVKPAVLAHALYNGVGWLLLLVMALLVR